MKVICKGHVYDLSYSCFETVCKLPYNWEKNAVGNQELATRELRLDKASGDFYVCTSTNDWDRRYVKAETVPKKVAAEVAEDFLDYEQYKKFFGDPEGELMNAKREAENAKREAEEAKSNKDYWYSEYGKRGETIDELKKQIEELKGKLGDHGID